jgi:hypothetical protein
MSKSARWILALLLIGLGVALLALVWKPLGLAVIVIGALVMPWHAGMAGTVGGD